MNSRDKIEQHLIKQKARSWDGKEGCLYRGPNNTMCAVGCLIPDDKYQEHFEGNNVHHFIACEPDILPRDIPFAELEMWQRYHDVAVYFGDRSWKYTQWVEGDEEHHPTKFKEALLQYLEEENNELS